MSVLVTQSASQDIAFKVGGSNGICAQTFTLTPSYSFVSLSGFNLVVATNDPNDVGTHALTIEVKLTDYPLVLPRTKTMNISITCVVQTLTFDASTPTSVIFRVGAEAQPFSIMYSVTKTPLCLQGPTFTLSAGSPAFIFNSPGSFGGTLSINGALPFNKGTYTFDLTAVVDGKTAVKTITLQVQDLCEGAIIQATPATLSTMLVTMPSTGLSTQNFSFATDVEGLYPLLTC